MQDSGGSTEFGGIGLFAEFLDAVSPPLTSYGAEPPRSRRSLLGVKSLALRPELPD